ncbi:MAG: hypothetical protein IPJ82_25665 [Lewinellaceae bacterium]|nr:hypothetical protein [Lewinellaceae bacterium]
MALDHRLTNFPPFGVGTLVLHLLFKQVYGEKPRHGDGDEKHLSPADQPNNHVEGMGWIQRQSQLRSNFFGHHQYRTCRSVFSGFGAIRFHVVADFFHECILFVSGKKILV